jgi:hypothetical protein
LVFVPLTREQQRQNIWIKHLCLHGDDCRSDPAGIKVRAIQGKQAVTYLDPGLLTGSLSYVRTIMAATAERSHVRVREDLTTRLWRAIARSCR